MCSPRHGDRKNKIFLSVDKKDRQGLALFQVKKGDKFSCCCNRSNTGEKFRTAQAERKAEGSPIRQTSCEQAVCINSVFIKQFFHNRENRADVEAGLHEGPRLIKRLWRKDNVPFAFCRTQPRQQIIVTSAVAAMHSNNQRPAAAGVIIFWDVQRVLSMGVGGRPVRDASSRR